MRTGSKQRRATTGPKCGDIECWKWPWLHVEVKRGKSPRLWAALDQARRDARDDYAVLVMARRDRDRWCFLFDEDDRDRIVQVLQIMSGIR